MTTAVAVVGMGGALQALWAATGSVLNAGAVLGEALGHSAQALNNLATVAEETSGVYLDESRANRKTKLLALQREFAALEASGAAPAPVATPAFAIAQ